MFFTCLYSENSLGLYCVHHLENSFSFEITNTDNVTDFKNFTLIKEENCWRSLEQIEESLLWQAVESVGAEAHWL